MIRRIEVLGHKSLTDLALDMGPIRILIGPNAAGKSNVIDILRVLSEAVRSDIETAVSRRGGVDGVAFLGSEQKMFEIVLDYFVPDPVALRSRSDMRYRLKVAEHDGRAGVAEEELQIKRNRSEPGAPKLWFRAEWGKGEALRDPTQKTREPFDTGDPGVLALKALGFLEAYPRIRALRTFIEGWQFLSIDLARVREPHRDERATRLAGDASNLANVLRTLQGGNAYRNILEDLRALLDHVVDMATGLDRGHVLLLLTERPFPDPVEAMAMSDGTLRLLAMLTALETMPDHGLLCIEEPEHGLHPLLFGPLLDLVRERCPKTGTRQALVTTHSPDLVDAAEPDEIIPVERDALGATRLRQLDQQQLGKWMRDFRLGELWRMRQLGGVPR